MQTAIVLGVGPLNGLGAQLCIRFAREGLHVIVAGRTAEKLENVVRLISEEGNSAAAVTADACNEADVKALFEAAADELTLAIYNVGNNTPGRIDEMEAAYFEKSWRTSCFGGFLFGRETVRRMKSSGGTLLFTGASASLRGRADFGAFNSAKGALRNLAQAMAKEYAVDGIHVGHVVIDGPIHGDKIIERFPEYAEHLGEEGMISLEGIVDGYVFLHQQASNAWSFELDLRTSKENW